MTDLTGRIDWWKVFAWALSILISWAILALLVVGSCWLAAKFAAYLTGGF